MPDRPNPLKDQLPANAQKVGQPQAKSGPKIQGDPGSPCLISYPSASVPLVGTVGGGCVISKTNVRAMVGGLLIGAGAVITLGGVAVLAAAGFRHTKAGQFVMGAAEAVPGGAAVGAVLRGNAGGAGRATGQAVRQGREARVASERRQMRQLGEPRENSGLRVGRGAVHETPAGTRERVSRREDVRFESGEWPPF